MLAHVALLYRDHDEHVDAVATFAAAGVAAGEPVLVAVPEPRLSAIRDRLGAGAGAVGFSDMGALGANPSRILPEIAAFAEEHCDRPARFVGEPCWPGRPDCEADEAARHEALINVALAGAPLHVLCPYDASRLDCRRLADAERTHPRMIDHGAPRASTAYGDQLAVWAAADRPLRLPDRPLARFTVEGDVPRVRATVRDVVRAAGVRADAADELLVAVTEALTNAAHHGAPPVTLTVWEDGTDVVCDVEDAGGGLDDPLAGRRRPAVDALHGRGLWLINQLCDVVEVRSGPAGTTVRMRMRRPRRRLL